MKKYYPILLSKAGELSASLVNFGKTQYMTIKECYSQLKTADDLIE